MPYQPHTDEDRARMLSALGIDSVARLFDDIPEAVRANGLDLAAPEPEQLLSRRAERLAARNRVDLASFLGAGVYRHFIPAAVDQVISRGEFATAYTPYQPEVSQGTLQTIYEYQSLIAELTGLPVVSASHYDGAAATAEAILMTIRATGRRRVLASRAIQRHYLDTAATYLSGHDDWSRSCRRSPTARRTWRALERALASGDPVAGVRARPAERLRDPRADGRGGAPRTRCRRIVRRGDRTGLARGAGNPGEYGADICARRGAAAGHRSAVRRPVPRDPRARPPT